MSILLLDILSITDSLISTRFIFQSVNKRTHLCAQFKENIITLLHVHSIRELVVTN